MARFLLAVSMIEIALLSGFKQNLAQKYVAVNVYIKFVDEVYRNYINKMAVMQSETKIEGHVIFH